MFDDINLNREAVYVHHIAIVEIVGHVSQSRHVCDLSLLTSRGQRHAMHTQWQSV